MRLEDKELEGPDLEREQRLEELEDETREKDEELPEHAGPELVDAELTQRERVLDALQAILAHEELAISALYLPPREALALEALQAAVTGRDAELHTFLYAEDRKALLEQALAVLQQNLTRGDAQTLTVLHAKFEALTAHVADLRSELLGLEDAQDELISQHVHEVVKASPETADAESNPGFLASALASLTGPELPERPPHVSTLDGPEVAREPTASSLTGPGPEVVRETPPSSLYAPGELPVPAGPRPRLAAQQPGSARGTAEPATAPVSEQEPAAQTRAPEASLPVPEEEPAAPSDPPVRGKRGLSVRSSDKPRKKP